ncbi:MAG: hypothetical protein VZQ80_02025 [Lachnospiraceae bacterium]|nr:hypothetical protein [Lachnospiraceae bacterium]
MDILFTGNVNMLSQAFFDRLGAGVHAVVFTQERDVPWTGKAITVYPGRGGFEDLTSVFGAYEFDSVFFFSAGLNGAEGMGQEEDELSHVLSACATRRVPHFYYVTGNEPLSDEGQGIPFGRSYEEPLPVRTLRQMRRVACESLCREQSALSDMRVEILKLPYIYSITRPCTLRTWIEEADKGHLNLPASEDTEADFLCDEDLGTLIARMLDAPIDEPCHTMELTGANEMTYGDLAESICEGLHHQPEISYGMGSEALPVVRPTDEVRKEYYWYPAHVLSEDLAELRAGIEAEGKEQEKEVRDRNNTKLGDRIRILIEIIVVTIVAELLDRAVKGNVLLQFLDFRFLGIVLMGTMNGFYAGILTALTSCIAYLTESLSYSTAEVLFFNIQNWIPFATYFLMGAVCGYTTDHRKEQTEDVKAEYAILEQKYTFLSGLYGDVLKSREAFSEQIIGYRNSYGRIYSVVQKLNSMLPDRILLEAVGAMEDILDNDTIAIYTLQANSHFARLAICSKREQTRLARSLDFTGHEELYSSLQDRKLFVNRAMKEGEPAFAMPLYDRDNLWGMVAVEQAPGQMNMEFSNKFSIVTDLVSSSIERAITFEQTKAESDYIEGTRVLRPEVFSQVLSARQEMRRNRQADFVLLHILSEFDMALAEKVEGLIRSNDVMGLGEAGQLMVVLSQTREQDFSFIAPRFEEAGIAYEKVTEGGTPAQAEREESGTESSEGGTPGTGGNT